MPDAKIVVQLDTEGALKSLMDLESRIRETDLRFKRFGKLVDRRQDAGPGGEVPRASGADSAPSVSQSERRRKVRGGLLAGKPQVPNLARLIARKELDLFAAGVSALPLVGPVGARAIKFAGDRAIPLLQYGPAMASSAIAEGREMAKRKVSNLSIKLPFGPTLSAHEMIDEAFAALNVILEETSNHMADLDAKQKAFEGTINSFNQLMTAQWGAGVLDPEGQVGQSTDFAKSFLRAAWDLEEMKRKKEITMRRFLYRNLGQAAPAVLKQFAGGK